MLKLWRLGAGAVLLIALAGVALAEEAAPPDKFYKLDFVMKEVEAGKVLNSRSYSVIISGRESDRASIRTGSKVPFNSGNMVQYADIGVNIDCIHVHELGDNLTMQVEADLSNIPQEQPGNPPVVRQDKWNSMVIVPLRKPTTLFSSDDPASRQQVQLELTATPIR